MQKFNLTTNFKPKGDQPQAIKKLVDGLNKGLSHQVFLGITGSGKTFSIANVIAQVNRPALIMAPNKTLAAQLYGEFKELFPENAVEFFVSYYDYYQPEAYVPQRDLYIEKDSAINEKIDKLRHSATHSLLTRRDVIIVASVSCIYGLGSPEAYKGMLVQMEKGREFDRNKVLSKLVEIQYERNDYDFSRGTFRVRGDTVEVFPAYEDSKAVRLEFFGDELDSIKEIDPLTGKLLGKLDQVAIYPNSHYVTEEKRLKSAMVDIEAELEIRVKHFKSIGKLVEAQRIEQRTKYDLEMIEEIGFCKGIENYSRYLTGRKTGEAPPTLMEYLSKDAIIFLDESHIGVSQIGGMYKGDRTRKETLVEYGFRLPSALDNRPLKFEEFERLAGQTIYVSATPADYEMRVGKQVVEQVIRPTGLMDPSVEIRSAKGQVDDLLGEINKRVNKGRTSSSKVGVIANRVNQSPSNNCRTEIATPSTKWCSTRNDKTTGDRVLVTTLTKRMSEELTEYYREVGVRVKYMHSGIDSLERNEIIRDLRLGKFDVLIGINLLREGLDLPEVSLVAILDADKEGFLRSKRSLIQTFGRASRNVDGHVILYADKVTDSMKYAIDETNRRRKIQGDYNKKHRITPETIKKSISDVLHSIYEADYDTSPDVEIPDIAPDQIPAEIERLRREMFKAAEDLDFELAAELRDKVNAFENIQLK